MRLLLDTHLLIRIAEDSDRLSKTALRLIEDDADDLVFSVASLWEISIKIRGRARVVRDRAARIRRGLLDMTRPTPTSRVILVRSVMYEAQSSAVIHHD